MVELDDGHGDGGDQTWRSSAPTWKEEREKQKPSDDQDKGIK